LTDVNKGSLFTVLEREIVLFKEQFAITKDLLDEESVHDLRVIIKRLRAIVYLLEQSAEEFKKEKHYEIFNDIFEKTGKLREIHVNQSILAIVDSSNKTELFKYLKKKEGKSIKKAVKAIDSFKINRVNTFSNNVQTRITGLNSSQFIRETYKIVKARLLEIKQVIEVDEKNIKLHRIRTQMNVLRAICDISNSIKQSDILERIIFELNAFHKDIGHWHDDEVFIKTCNKFLNKHKTKNQNEIESVIQIVSERKISQENNLIEQLKVFAQHI